MISHGSKNYPKNGGDKASKKQITKRVKGITVLGMRNKEK